MKKTTIESPKTKEENFWEKHANYYKLLEFGALFLQFIRKNLKENKQMDRATKRRIGRALEKGRFTDEMIDYYKDYVKDAINYIDKEATKVYLKYKSKDTQPPATVNEAIKKADKAQKDHAEKMEAHRAKRKKDAKEKSKEEKTVDGEEYYNKLKEDEKDGKK